MSFGRYIYFSPYYDGSQHGKALRMEGSVAFLPAAFDVEEAQPAIDQTVVGKSGAYELKFTQNGLTGLINGQARVSTANYGTARNFNHLAFVYDGAKTRLIVNGVEKASADLSGAINTNSNSLLIGAGLKGAIDEVKVWDFARKTGSLLGEKEKCLNGNESGLKCYLRFNENTGTGAADATTNVNNGTLAAGVTWVADPFVYSNGLPNALYHMDEGTGNAYDLSGNNNTLALSADVNWSNTDLTGFSTGKSLNFNVASTYGSAANSSSLNITGKLSLEAWIKPTDNTGTRVILVKGDDTQSRWNYKLYQSNDTLVFSIYNGGERSATTPAFIIPNNIYHIVVTLDESTQQLNIYANNVLKYSGLLGYAMVTNSDPLRIGKDKSDASLSFKGLIDEVRIYKRVLAAEEVKRHYEHRLLAVTEPALSNVYNPPVAPEIGAYADNNPVIQPVMGVFYSNKNLMQLQELANKPVNADIKYQISRDGYWWFWFNGTNWAPVDAGYSQANTYSEVNANLGAFQNMSGFDQGDFYYRAYLHSEPSSYKTPSLDNVATTLYSTETFYIDPTGATAINPDHTNADSDRWFQYKAMLYSDGETTPILDDVNIEYIRAYIKVNTPNGGESLSVGDHYNITWDSQAITNTTGYVKLEYFIAGQPTTIAVHVPNTGTYTWTVPDVPSDGVTVKISSEDFSSVSDVSDADFKIMSLVVNSPNGGEAWEQAKTHNITWTATGNVPQNVLEIDYSTDNGSTWSIVNAVTPNTGSYSWLVPLAASDQVLVKVFSTYSSSVKDTSNAVFSIVPNPVITITGPAGGEIWSVGEKHNIAWTTNTRQFSDQVILEYSNDEFVSDIHTIAQVSVGTPAGAHNNDHINGTYEWTIPDAVSAAMKVRVRELSVPPGRDTQVAASKKSSAFSIIEPSIAITAPVSADVFVAGDTHNITWTTVGTISNDLLLEYSLDGGQTYVQIATGLGNSKTYSWVLPGGISSDNAYVRITDNQRTQVKATSQPFKILAYPKITLTQPNGGEQLTIGTAYSITWQTFGQKLEPGGSDYNKVSVYYSVDNGVNWTLISYQSANTKTYSWTVPDHESSQCLVKVIDDNDARAQVVSVSPFTIVLPVIRLTYPNGGESWFATGKYNITWSSTGTISNNLKIEFSSNNGASWATVATGVGNTGTYEWGSVTDVITAQALIRITDASRPSISDTSNAKFNVVSPSITVVFPNGGEEFAVGSMQEITWSSDGGDFGAIKKLTLQYSTDGGVSWTDIDSNQDNDGSYMWIVPDSLSNNCRVRIFDSSRIATMDASNGNFKIMLPTLRITAPNGNESWPIGTHKNITWTSVGAISDNLKLEYSKDNFVSSVTIATGAHNTGSYDWTIPDDQSVSVKVRITDSNRTEISDVSDAAFIIANPVIRVTAPNGGELWNAQDTENITWENTGSVGNSVKIEYSKDNFISDVNLINAGASNTGTYPWNIPTDVSSTVRVRVTDNGRTTVWDKSDQNFTILPSPVITLVSPIGSAEGHPQEQWSVGSQHDITWTDNGGKISNNLTIQYCTDGGTTWKPLAVNVPNTGSHSWTVPDDVSANCKVKIFDTGHTATYSISPNAFKITEPTITITSPNGGEFWAVGDSAPITWTSAGMVSDNLIFEWSPNNGTDYYPIRTGIANTGSSTWTVSGDFPSTSTALFRITDGNRITVKDVSNQVFTIIPSPAITITAPAGGEELVLGDAKDITWTHKGLSITDNLLIEISNDNFVTRQIIDQGKPNTGRYNWLLSGSTLTGTTLKIRITDAGRTDVHAVSNGYFRIRGGFTVLSPNGNEYWTAGSTQTISWQTRGSVPRVKLEYSIDQGDHWVVITASTPNQDSYTWTLPDVKAASVKVRVSDPDDATTTDTSDANFAIVYATVTFKVMDYDTLQHLQDFNVSEPATGWSDSGVQSPKTRTEAYPYGTYTTFVTKSNYIDNSVTWNPPKQGNTPYVVTLYLENSASAQVTWESILSYSFSPANDALSAVGSLQRKGKLVGTDEMERADMGAAVLTIYQPDGTTVRTTLSAISPNTSGMYNFSLSATGFEAGKVYPAVLSIEYRGRPYVSSANIDVGSEILQYQFFTQTAQKLTESVSTIQQAVTSVASSVKTNLQETQQNIETQVQSTETALKAQVQSSETTLKAHVSDVLTTAENNLKAKVDEVKDQTVTAMKSQILNTDSAVKSGNVLTIRYRTYSGLSPAIDVYNAQNVQEITKGAMKEIGATEIYEYNVTFNTSWGRGDYTIVCSESTKGSLDALVISVEKTDLEQVYNQVSSVLGTTSGISSLKNVADNLGSQFGVIESALSKVGRDIVKEVKDGASSATALESVYSQLSGVAKEVRQMAGNSGLNLEKLYNVSVDKKQDLIYLKNKTQELKAAMDLNQKTVEDLANKPVTATVYEYK